MKNVFALSGGLEVQKHALFSQSGTLTDCRNFEVSVESGYRRIEGIVPYCGKKTPIDTNFQFSGAFATFSDPDLEAPVEAIDQGSTFYFLNSALERTYEAVVISSTLTGPSLEVYLMDAIITSAADATIDYIAGFSVNVSGTDYIIPLQGYTLNQLPIFSDSLELLVNDNVPVPGRLGGDVHFTHLYQDDTYATMDYESYLIDVTNSTQTLLINDGDTITNDASTSTAKVVKAYGSTNTGALLRLIVQGETGPKFSFGEQINVLNRGALTPPLAFGGFGVPLAGFGFSKGLKVIGTVKSQTDNTEAGLWRSLPTGGWVEVDQLREIRFNAGTVDMGDVFGSLYGTQISNLADASLTDTGAKFPSSARSLFSTISGVTSLFADDGTATTAPTQPAALNFVATIVQGFDMSAIPSNAGILGVEVSVERKAGVNSATEWVKDLDVRLTGVGVPITLIGGLSNSIPISVTNKAATTEQWGTSYVIKTYGASTDLWGQAITVDQIKSTDFGVYFVAERARVGANCTTDANIDYITVKVHYLNPNGKVFFYSANATPTNVSADILAIQLFKGDYASGTAEGIMTVRCDSVASLGRNIEAGDDIRSASGAPGGVQYAKVTSPMERVTQPSQKMIDAEGSVYRAISANFYGSEEFEGMYACSGAGPAFGLDKTGLVRIHPDLTSDLNKPRHIAQHGLLLMLGFKNGSAFSSVAGTPYNFNGRDGAREIAFGSRITGFLSFQQDLLAVFCRDKIDGLRGFEPSSFQQTTISPSLGAIEYTVENVVGRPMFTSHFGVSTLDTTANFGDFFGSPLSESVWPILRPRVQSLAESDTLRVAFAYSVRSKNQYRLVFKDGNTMTFTLSGLSKPEVTSQLLEYSNGDSVKTFVPRHVSSAVDSLGRERVFGVHRYASNWGINGQNYVYEFEKLWFLTFRNDSGNGFDALPIQSWFVTNWTDSGNEGVLQRFDHMGIYGRSSFPVDFQVGRSANYALTTDQYGVSSNMQGVSFGVVGEDIPVNQYNRMASVELAIEGMNVALRFESKPVTPLPPFTISAIALHSTPHGQTRGLRR